jgi:hypothetical protein
MVNLRRKIQVVGRLLSGKFANDVNLTQNNKGQEDKRKDKRRQETRKRRGREKEDKRKTKEREDKTSQKDN